MQLFNNELDSELPSPLVLAYLGDAVYELFVRKELISRGHSAVNNLHMHTVKLVKASSQAKLLHEIEDKLTLEEIKIVKKGRNTKSTVPKNADMVDYRYSTGLEALLGYLYWKKENQRLEYILQSLMKISYNLLEE